jgi:ATP phosphoribosyltransferase regulatory subunit
MNIPVSPAGGISSQGGAVRPPGPRRTARGLQLPRGAESLHLEDAYVHHQMVRRIFSLCTSWGYLPLETPVLDFFDIYQALLDDDNVHQVYRLVDRDGDLLMLRSDITLFMAKQVAVALEGMRLKIK